MHSDQSIRYLEAEEISGGLSKTSKMPGFSWGLSASLCHTGSKLREHANSVCANCYALKGRYVFTTVKNKLQRRLEGIKHPRWVEAMIIMIDRNVASDASVFRWFDTGDLQSIKMLNDICEIAVATPLIQHWLPTREKSIVKQVLTKRGKFPENLCVRLSDPMIIDVPFMVPDNSPASVVISKVHKAEWESLMLKSSKTMFFCRAPLQNNQCLGCRACWNPNIGCIAYLEH